MPSALFALVLVLFLTALIFAIEAAMSKMTIARLEELEVEEKPAYRSLVKVLEDKPRHINALQALSSVGWAASVVLLLRFFNADGRSATTDVTAVVIMSLVGFMVFGVGAKTLGKQHAETLSRSAAGIVRRLAWLMSPVVRLMILVGNAITPGKGYEEGPFATAAEFRELVDQASDEVLEDDERRMIRSVFELGDTVAREVMVPRTEMVWIESTKTLRQAMSLSLRSGYSRIPVVGEDIDDIVGVVYMKDVAQRVFEHGESQTTERVDSLMRPVLMSPDSKQIDDLLREMQHRRTHITVLIDEYGGTAGLVTIEDILEEIVGEISDEYDTGAPEIVELSENSYRVSARLHIEDLAELLRIELDADEEGIDTIAGLLAARLGRVAIPGSTITVEGWTLMAESAAGRRNKVGSILVSREAEDDDE
jgi:CBS domain containing-hemolysin-like protein